MSRLTKTMLEYIQVAFLTNAEQISTVYYVQLCSKNVARFSHLPAFSVVLIKLCRHNFMVSP